MSFVVHIMSKVDGIHESSYGEFRQAGFNDFLKVIWTTKVKAATKTLIQTAIRDVGTPLPHRRHPDVSEALLAMLITRDVRVVVAGLQDLMNDVVCAE